MMMSRYAHHPEMYEYSPPSSPKGRRFILKNFNAKKEREKKLASVPTKESRYYLDLRTVPPSQGSNLSKRSGNSHVGTSNRVMPTDERHVKGGSPRKTPRDPPLYVSPRKEPNVPNVTPRADVSKGQKDSKAVAKQTLQDSNKKGSNKNDDRKVVVSKNKNGLTPRDEYMVTKLYGRQIIYLKPSEIRYTHDQITAHFNDGRSMLSTFISLLYGRVEIRLGGNDVPPVEVMQVDEIEGKQWYVVNGNRRLYVMKKVEKCGALPTMQVIARKYDSIEMDKQFLTRNRGKMVSITNDATLEAKIGNEVKRWKDWKVNQSKKQPQKAQQGKKNVKSSQGANTSNSSCCCIS